MVLYLKHLSVDASGLSFNIAGLYDCGNIKDGNT